MARGLGKVAPCFVDADTAPFGADASGPKGGLTTIVFLNHLVYLIAWYFLALMVAGAGSTWRVARCASGGADPRQGGTCHLGTDQRTMARVGARSRERLSALSDGRGSRPFPR